MADNYNSCFSSQLCDRRLLNDIVEDCNNPMYAGIEAAGVIINREDIATIVRDANNQHIVKAITLKAGARAYKFFNDRNNPFTGTSTSVNVNDYRNDFTHTVAGFIPMDGAEPAQEIITPLANGKFVVILQNQWLHADSDGGVDNEFQIFGIDRGLKVSTLTRARYENNDYWTLELTEENVPRAATYFIATEDTCAALSALVNGGNNNG